MPRLTSTKGEECPDLPALAAQTAEKSSISWQVDDIHKSCPTDFVRL
jgi:hypothetical protein